MPTEIDNLTIAINAEAKTATDKIDELCDMFDRLENSLNTIETGKLNKISESFENLSSSLKGISNINAGSFKNITKAIDTLSKTDFSTLDSIPDSLTTLKKGFDSIGEINFETGKLDEIANSLRKFGYATNTKATENLKTLKTDLVDFINGINSAGEIQFNFETLQNLTTDLSKLGGKKVTQATENLQLLNDRFLNFINELNGSKFDTASITELVSGISKLGGKASTNAIENIPKLSTAVNELMNTLSKSPQVSQNVIQMTNALANLASQGSKVSSASKSISNSLKNTTKSVNVVSQSFKGLASYLGKFYANWYLVIRGFNKVWDDIKSSMDYIETSNYFETALGQIGKQFEEAGQENAIAYTEALKSELNNLNKKLTGYTLGKSGEALFDSDIGLGMDIEQMMNFQAKTLAVTNSVGLLGEASLGTSKALSMLAGDLSSLTNLDISDVMDNLSSGLLGQSETLYKYGIDITDTTLKQYALAEGIEKSVSEMTQSEKMQLRLLAILDQSEIAWGDLGNTVNSVANQYRIFEQQIGNLGRTFGNLFLPIIKNVLPYVNGLIIALNNLFTTLGFDIWGDTWLEDLQGGISGGVAEGLEDVENAADEALESVNKFIKGVRSFDELNVLSTSSSSSSVSDELEETIDLTASITEAVAKYEEAWNKAFETAENKASEFAKKIEKILEPVKKLLEDIKIGDWFAVGEDVSNLATSIFDFFSKAIDKVEWDKIGENIGSFIAGIDWTGVFNKAVNLITKIAGASSELIIGTFTGFLVGKIWDVTPAEDLANRFGNIALSLSEIENVAKYIVNSGNLTEVSNILSSLNNLQDFQSNMETSISQLNKLNWKVSVGMELTEDDENTYKTAIDSYIKNANSYIETQQYAANIGMEIFLDNSDSSAQVQAVVNSFYNNQSEKLRKLGEELNQVTTEAWNDGLLTIDEIEVISSIQLQMADIQEKISTAEFEARMQVLQMDYSGAELTPESYQKLQEERQKIIDDYTSDLNESLVFSIAQINLAYQAAIDEEDIPRRKEELKQEWENAIKELQEGRDLKVSEMVLKSLSFDFTTVIETFGEDLDTTFDGMIDMLSVYAKKFAEEADWTEQGIASFMTDVINLFEKEAGKAGAENFKLILESMMPLQDIEELAQDFYETSGEVPQAIADAIISEYALTAISGNLDSLYKLMLVSTDSENAQAVLEQMEKFGMEIPEFLAKGVISNANLADMSLTDILDNLDETLSDTGLPERAKKLGKEISEGLSEGLSKGSGLSGFSAVAFGEITSIPQYAVGGFPEDGWFRASKGEYFGQFDDGTSYIANNNQIVEGIESGVYRAVLSAMGNNSNTSSSSPEIKVYIGEREIEEVAINGINRKYREGKNPLYMLY